MIYNISIPRDGGDKIQVTQAPEGITKEGEHVFRSKKLEGEESFTFSRMMIKGVDDWEVVSWIRDNIKGKVEFFHEEARDENDKSKTVMHFRFHDLDDALRFKFCFAEGLERGATAY
jgi:hypothetical protein